MLPCALQTKCASCMGASARAPAATPSFASAPPPELKPPPSAARGFSPRILPAPIRSHIGFLRQLGVRQPSPTPSHGSALFSDHRLLHGAVPLSQAPVRPQASPESARRNPPIRLQSANTRTAPTPSAAERPFAAQCQRGRCPAAVRAGQGTAELRRKTSSVRFASGLSLPPSFVLQRGRRAQLERRLLPVPRLARLAVRAQHRPLVRFHFARPLALRRAASGDRTKLQRKTRSPDAKHESPRQTRIPGAKTNRRHQKPLRRETKRQARAHSGVARSRCKRLASALADSGRLASGAAHAAALVTMHVSSALFLR